MKRIAELTEPVLLGTPEATIWWICSEYVKQRELGIPRAATLAAIDAHRTLLSGTTLEASIRSRWLRSYAADRVAAEHGDVEYPQDYAYLAVEFLTPPWPLRDLAIDSSRKSCLHPLARPAPFGILEREELTIEVMQAIAGAQDSGNAADAIARLDEALLGPDSVLLQEGDRQKFQEYRDRVSAKL